MSKLEVLSLVALLRDLPEHGLLRGQVGTVVELLSPAIAEVEFSDDEGRTYAMIHWRTDIGLWVTPREPDSTLCRRMQKPCRSWNFFRSWLCHGTGPRRLGNHR